MWNEIKGEYRSLWCGWSNANGMIVKWICRSVVVEKFVEWRERDCAIWMRICSLEKKKMFVSEVKWFQCLTLKSRCWEKNFWWSFVKMKTNKYSSQFDVGEMSLKSLFSCWVEREIKVREKWKSEKNRAEMNRRELIWESADDFPVQVFVSFVDN